MRALNIGVAAHITAAAIGGPRFDASLTSEQRAEISNAIWLCQNCAKLVDNDLVRYTADTLREWKSTAEARALDRVGKATGQDNHKRLMVDKWVNLDYVQRAGIVGTLESKGYDLRWSRANEESERIEFDGWKPVVVDEPDGRRARLKIRDHSVVGGYLILLRRPKP